MARITGGSLQAHHCIESLRSCSDAGGWSSTNFVKFEVVTSSPELWSKLASPNERLTVCSLKQSGPWLFVLFGNE